MSSTFMGAYDGTDFVDLGDGFKVEYKRCLSAAENEIVLKASYTFSTSGVTQSYDPFARYREAALASIVSWNLTDLDGSVLPFEHNHDEEIKTGKPSPLRVSYARLPGHVADKIEMAVNQANRAFEREEAARFPDAGVGGDEDGGDDPPDDSQVLE